MSSFDPDKFRLHRSGKPFSKQSPPSSPPKPSSGEKFLKGPIPLNWLIKASSLPGKSMNMAVVLWYISGLTKKSKVSVSNKLASQFSIDRHAKYRALGWLTEAKLISVVTKVGKSPRITLLDAGGSDDTS